MSYEQSQTTDDKSDSKKEELITAIAQVILRNYRNFEINAKRIRSLIAMSEIFRGENDEIRLHRDDLLRAAVVFLHAAVEELLRGLAIIYLPTCSEEVLNGIPLAESGDSLRPEKFLLGALNRHRGKTIDELIMLSVEQHISRRSFNDTSDIARLLTALGFKIEDSLKENFSESTHSSCGGTKSFTVLIFPQGNNTLAPSMRRW